ncbi:efflux RND transporter periplasmic adaptor subunit [Membranihabitans maritimus]|uniref:efflux RND transporter periplasmic adaptor subunit n=1 Tax=Membranihabitans maritimus TaxID=2904244 RepID=UPI001F01E830|nr:efflux RND transporter periplasmic adaptor subunit [Membranihabitans maritimus]
MNRKVFYNQLFIYFLCVSAFFVSCQQSEKSGTGGEMQKQTPSFPVIEVINGDIRSTDHFPASIEGIENIEIRAKVDGYIQQIYVDEGDFVSRGQQLFKLETQSLTQDANAAQSSIKVAEAGVNAAQVEVDKLRPLVEKGIISDVQLKTAQANLESAKSRLAQSESNYKSVTENIRYTNIVSPVNGVIGMLPYRKGTLVGRTETQPLTTVSNISKVYAYFAMNEKDFLDFMESVEGETIDDKIESMEDVELILANGRVYEHKGVIETVTGQIDPQTGTINFRATFPNPEHKLRSGSSGTISIPKQYDSVVLIPEQSTYDMQGRKFVYKIGENDSLKSIPLNYLDIVDGVIVLADGLEAGDRILAEGIGKVKNGMVINPQSASFDDYAGTIEPVFK